MEFKFKKILCFVLVIVMTISLCGCTTFNNFKAAFIDPKDEELKIVKIGVLEPLTGSDAAGAADEVKGIEIANSIYGFVNGAKIELVYADNQSEVSLCDAAVNSLVEAGAVVILGSYDSVLTLASSDVIKENRIPAIAITNTNPIVTSTNNYYFRVCYTDEFEGNAAANYIYNQMQTTNTAIFYKEGYDYASALASAYKAEMENLSGVYDNIVTIKFSEGRGDFTELFENLQEISPDAIFFPGTLQDAKTVISEAIEQGYNFNWVGTSKWDGINLEGVCYTLDYDPDMPTTRQAGVLAAKYKELYGDGKTVPEATALGFDAYLLATSGLNGSDFIDDKELVTQAIEAVKSLEGATGYITMSSSGDPIKEVLVEKYENGTRSTVYTITQEGDARE